MNAIQDIKPGKNYPVYAVVTEPDNTVISFTLCSYAVGMYCQVNVNGNLANQTGDHDNRKFVRGLKRDLLKAISRGSKVELGSFREVKSI